MTPRCFRSRTILPILLTGLMLAGCTDFPELDATVPRHLDNADYPRLVPIETLLVPLPPPQEQSESLQTDLENRRDSLQNRARRLNTPVVDEDTQARMQTGIAG